jgi:8-oxo-dGTP pyrophosphatase MutT (NUDIX family)
MNETSTKETEASTLSIERSLMTRLRLRLLRPYFRWTRAMTLGARIAVIDEKGRFLLVKHTYSPGWIFPGGGVEAGESCIEAAERELREEAQLIPKGPLQLHGIFANHRDFPGDHLAFYVLKEFEMQVFTPNSEIADARFFAPENIPESTTQGSRRRIDELVNGKTASPHW